MAHNARPPIAETLAMAPVVPVLTIRDEDTAVALGHALVAGGLPVLEVTLRTPVAREAAQRMIDEVEGAIVGLGTVTTPTQYQIAVDMGAQFCVCPGFTTTLLDAVEGGPVPLLPGAATPAEAMTLFERGYNHQKFFPAEPAGGTPMLKSIAAPLPEIIFCPTGGISASTAPSYLALPNVVCVGGSWIAPADAIEAGDWAQIETLAAKARALGNA